MRKYKGLVEKMQNKFNYPKYYRTFACIDLNAIAKNLSEIKKIIKKETKVMAVVKADAYGHGAVRVAQEFDETVDYFAVAVIDEAMQLRRNGVKKPILLLSYSNPLGYKKLIQNNVSATVYDENEAIALSKVARQLGKNVVIHIKIETGMNRIGFADNDESVEAIERITKLPFVTVEGIFSHFACADDCDKTSANKQTARFKAFLQKLEQKNIHIALKHMCNSGGIIDLDDHYDMVRVGISMYGIYPSNEVKKDRIELKPAMKVVSHVIYIKTVLQGERIGYGHTYEAKSDRKIATVWIGYADGFNRSLSNKGYVLINGQKASVVGNVCMDQMMVDVTNIKDVAVGDFATILGKDGDKIITAEEFGELSGSFSYEVVCTFMPRIKRFYYYGDMLLEDR